MEARDCCSSLETELRTWKEKVDDVTGRFDRLSSGDKEKTVQYIVDLHMLNEELGDRIDTVQRQCTIDFLTEGRPGSPAQENDISAREPYWEDLLFDV